MDRFPSFVDFQGMYNVPRSGRRDLSIHQTVRNPPPITWAEYDSIRGKAQTLLEAHGQEAFGFTVPQSRTYFRYCVGEQALDRTLRVELPEVRLLNEELVLRWQHEVLSKHPLWRIMVVNRDPSTVVMAYPEAIRCGTAPSHEWKTGLPEIVEKESDLRDAQDGSVARQLLYLTGSVPPLMRDIGFGTCVYCCVFDRSNGNTGRLSAWLLHRSDSRWDYGLDKPQGVMSGSTFAIDINGAFGPHFEDETGYWLREWVFPAGASEDLLISKYVNCRPVLESHRVVQIGRSSIIKDDDLRNLFPRNCVFPKPAESGWLSNLRV